MAIWSSTSHPFGFSPRRKFPPLDILNFLVTTLRNQDKKVEFIWFDEDGALARSSKFMKTCHNMNIIVQTIGIYASSLNSKIEIPNKTLANIKRALLLKSSHKKEIWCFAYKYYICLSCQTYNILCGDDNYFLWYGIRPSYKKNQNTGYESLYHQWTRYKK